MTQFLILTKSQTDAIRGPTRPGKALDPVALTDGRFVLPLSVLDDDHGEKNPTLAALPVLGVDADLFLNTEAP